MNWKFAVALFGLVILGVMLTGAGDGKASSPARRVKVEEFAALTLKPEAVIVDVRTPEEFALGHIKKAVNIDYHDSRFESKVSALDKSKTYLVYCASGARSARACKKMSQLMVTNLVELAPGFSGWEDAGKPVEK